MAWDDDLRPVSRAEFEALRRRLAAMEDLLRARGIAPPPPPEPQAAPPPAAPPPEAPAAPSPVDSLFHRVAPPPTPPPRSIPPPAAKARPATTPMSIESLLGRQWAPRVGAILVFLAVLFFLGVAIQRGWIGPLLQLGIAVLAGAALLGAGAWLTARKGYGTYPQVLEATGALVLYLTAFLAYALPYYQRETRLTELGGGVLMALVAAGTVALALVRDARVIAGLGYALGFVTAGIGLGVMPALTLPYVALLGSSLAFLVARKGWVPEGAAGTVATGGLLLALLARPDAPEAAIALVSLVPAGAFLALTLRRLDPGAQQGRDSHLAGLVALGTYAWVVVTSDAPFDGPAPLGGVMLGFAALGVSLCALAARRRAGLSSAGAHALAALALSVVGVALLWWEQAEAPILMTASYALMALALLLAARPFPRAGRWLAAGAFVLLVAGVVVATGAHAQEAQPWSPREGLVSGSWQAWASLLVLLPGLALLALRPPEAADDAVPQFGLVLGVVFVAAWAFVLFPAPFLATLWLVALAGGALAWAAPRRDRTLLGIAAVLLGVAALKGTVYDFHLPDVRLPGPLAALQAALLAGALLAAHALVRRGGLLSGQDERAWSVVLVGASAAVLADAMLVYLEGPAVSIGLGALGVVYLAAGFVLRGLAVYRYAGFALLGFVLLRVFLVDLQETDLAVRALVFAVLGAILLGVGYVYARQARKAEAQAPAPPEGEAPP